MKTPEKEPTVAVSLTVKNADEALDFYALAFGTTELFRMKTPDGIVAHAEFMIGDTKLYISNESPEWHALAMAEGATAASLLVISTDDCDCSYQRALSAGGEGLNSPEDQFWGARTAMIKDPYGYRWSFRQITEQLTPDEIMTRAQQLFGGK